MRKLLFLSVAVIGSLILLSCGSTDSTTNYQISISASPSEGGTVSPSNGQYEEGTSLDISATASEEYRFVEWQGDYSGSSSSATITVDSDKNIQAIFAKKEYALTINTEGEGSVDETVVQAKSTDYEHGTVVELTANPAEGWEFVEWQGDLTGNKNPTQITIDEPKTIVSVFQKKVFVGGKGTKEDPYKIANVVQLQAVSNYLNSHFIQISNVEASNADTLNNGLGFIPIGANKDTSFTGSFNGNSFKITNLKIEMNGNEYSGLFINNAGKIQNVNLVDVNISGDFFTGGLVANNLGVIKKSTISGTVSGKVYVGGLVGINNTGGTIIGSKSSVIVTVTEVDNGGAAGGLAGYNESGGLITNSSSSGTVKGYGDSGGLVGVNSGIIKKSYSNSTVDGGESFHTGGFVGVNRGTIKRSYSDGKTSGRIDVGGFVGVNRGEAIILNSYAKGEVKAAKQLGGFVGSNDGIIKKCYTVSEVTVVNGSKKNEGGGFVDSTISGVIMSSYWNTETTNQSSAAVGRNPEGIVGLTTSEMSGEAAKENMNVFDFSEVWVTSNNYPVLFWE